VAIVGHFKSLAEAQKLVQSVLLQGVVQEIIEEGQLLPKLPVFTITGKSVKYNREKTLPSGDFYDTHEQIPWNADVDYATQVEVELKRIARQDILDNFMLKTYKDPNDYETIIVSELRKGVMRTIEQKLIYGDATTYPKEFDGLWGLVDSNMQIENHATGGALSLAKLRELIDSVKLKPIHMLLMPFEIARRIDAAMQEGDLGKGQISWAVNQIGERVTYFQGIPIVRSDYMKMTEGDKTRTGGSNGSIWAIHLGQIQDGGLCLATGGDTGGVDFFKVIRLEELEDYDAAGIRLVAYCALALGSTKALGQLCNITDAPVTA